MNEGVIRSVKDLVVRVVFADQMPEVNELVLVDNEAHTPLLVDSLTTGNIAICLNIRADHTLQKNMKVKTTGKSIEIPVGNELIGRVVDALGAPIDGLPPV